MIIVPDTFDDKPRRHQAPQQTDEQAMCLLSALLDVTYDELVLALPKPRKNARVDLVTWLGTERCPFIFAKAAFPASRGQKRMDLDRFVRHVGSDGRWLVKCSGYFVAVINGQVIGKPETTRCISVFTAYRLRGRKKG